MKRQFIALVALIAATLPAWAGGYATYLQGTWKMAEAYSEVREMSFRADNTFSIRLYSGEVVTGAYSIEKHGRLAMALDSSPDIPVGAVISLSPDNTQLTIHYRRHEQHFVRASVQPRLASLR